MENASKSQRHDLSGDLTPREAAALEQGGFVLTDKPSAADPLTEAVAEYAALLKSSLSIATAGRRLGMTSRRVRQRLASEPPTLYGIRIGASWYIPEFQFDGDRLVPGMGEVVAGLNSELHPIALFRWFSSPNPDLLVGEPHGRTLSPRDWLLLGLPVSSVVELATSL
jgi:hypothetical protein